MWLFSLINHYKLEIILTLLCVLSFFAKSVFFENYLGDRDIYYQYTEAMKIKEGKDPYERILGQDLRLNRKYPTFLPSSYLLLLALAAPFDYDFVALTFVVRCLTALFASLAAFVLLKIGREHRVPLLGLAAASLWLFNRWSVYNFAQARLDVLALSCAVFAVYFYRTEALFWPFLLMSISLGIKHLGVFVLPLFLFDSLRERRWGSLCRRMFILLSIPLAFSLPFVLRNPSGFLYSLGFSFTRLPEGANIGYGWEVITNRFFGFLLTKLKLVGTFPGTILFYLSPRSPLFILSLLLLSFSYLERWGKYLMALVGMLLFLSLNPVLFNQYFIWVMPFILISGIETFAKVGYHSGGGSS